MSFDQRIYIRLQKGNHIFLSSSKTRNTWFLSPHTQVRLLIYQRDLTGVTFGDLIPLHKALECLQCGREVNPIFTHANCGGHNTELKRKKMRPKCIA